jgi:hypothetical protein
MSESSITATSSEDTFGWPSPMAAAVIATVRTRVAPKRIARFRLDRNARLTGAAA